MKDCGVVSGQTLFPGSALFTYTVRVGPDRSTPNAAFANTAVAATFPGPDVAQWADSSEVTLRADIEVDGDTLALLVEKDFACLSPRADEDESDLFPHPEAGERTC